MNTIMVYLFTDGIERRYRCENQYDAIILFDALSRQYQHVELWSIEGMIKRHYNK
jgi:hypothetical protein